MENLEEKIRVFILERDRKQLLYEVGVGVGVVVLCKVTHFLLKYTLLNPIPTFEFPLPRDDNFKAIKKGFDEGKLPKIFRPKIFPGSTFRHELYLNNYIDAKIQ